MKVMSIEEMNRVLHPVTLDQKVRVLAGSLQQWGSGFSIPQDSGAKVGLARFFSSIFMPEPTSEAVIYISEFGVWPSSEKLRFIRFVSSRQGRVSTVGRRAGALFSRDRR